MMQNETQQSMPDSAQFATYKNALDDTIHDAGPSNQQEYLS